MLLRREPFVFCCLFYAVLADLVAFPFYSQYLLSYLHLRDGLSFLPLLPLFLGLQLLLFLLGNAWASPKEGKMVGMAMYLLQLGYILSRHDLGTLLLISLQSFLLGATFPLVQLVQSTLRPERPLRRSLLLSTALALFLKTNLVQSLVNSDDRRQSLSFYSTPIFEECVSENVYYILVVQSLCIIAMLCVQPEWQNEASRHDTPTDKVQALQLTLWFYSLSLFKAQTSHLSDRFSTLLLSAALLLLVLLNPRPCFPKVTRLALLCGLFWLQTQEESGVWVLALESLLLQQLPVQVGVVGWVQCCLGSVVLQGVGSLWRVEPLAMAAHLCSAVLLLRQRMPI